MSMALQIVGAIIWMSSVIQMRARISRRSQVTLRSQDWTQQGRGTDLDLSKDRPTKCNVSARRADRRRIDRGSQEATSPLGAALYVCHPRFTNGYCSN